MLKSATCSNTQRYKRKNFCSPRKKGEQNGIKVVKSRKIKPSAVKLTALRCRVYISLLSLDVLGMSDAGITTHGDNGSGASIINHGTITSLQTSHIIVGGAGGRVSTIAIT